MWSKCHIEFENNLKGMQLNETVVREEHKETKVWLLCNENNYRQHGLMFSQGCDTHQKSIGCTVL